MLVGEKKLWKSFSFNREFESANDKLALWIVKCMEKSDAEIKTKFGKYIILKKNIMKKLKKLQFDTTLKKRKEILIQHLLD
jgi:hypothetical protein